MSGFIGCMMLMGGAGLLFLGAEWLVRGSAGLARRMGISPLIVGLTVVAYGTSAPEVIVGIQAGWSGHGDMALGNVLGSNIANLGLILGLLALLRPAPVQATLARLEVPVLVIAHLTLGWMLWNGQLATWEAGLLAAMAVMYSVWMVFRARKDHPGSQALEVAEIAAETAGAPPGGTSSRLWVLVVVGLGLLAVGGHLLVEGASGIAILFGMSERMVGLTLVAVGTSLPELATSLVAAWKGHTEMAVGNVVGSNIFNILLCLGFAGLPGRLVTTPTPSNGDLLALGGITLLGIAFLRTERTIKRLEGLTLLAAYGLYLGWLVKRG